VGRFGLVFDVCVTHRKIVMKWEWEKEDVKERIDGVNGQVLEQKRSKQDSVSVGRKRNGLTTSLPFLFVMEDPTIEGEDERYFSHEHKKERERRKRMGKDRINVVSEQVLK
jgi:hypothetical protein